MVQGRAGTQSAAFLMFNQFKVANIFVFLYFQRSFLLLPSPVGQKMQNLERLYHQIQEQFLSHSYQTTEQYSHKLGCGLIFQPLPL